MKKLTATTMVFLALASMAGAVDLVATLEDVRPRGIGVDDQGHLWLLHAPGTRVTQVSPDGERRSWSIPKSWYVDVDSRWGAAALDPYGKELRVVSTEGDLLATIPMEHEAGDVAWIDESRVAVTPIRAAHRVEIWNVKTGSLVKTFGEEEAVVHRIGAYFVRRVFVEYHEASKRLHTLETRTGDYRAFDLDGHRLAARELENPRRAEFNAWIERVDRERTQMGEDLGMPMNWFRLATDPKGDAITVRGCDAQGTRALLVRVPMEGPPGEAEVQVACCSQEFTIWQSGIVFAEASSASGDGCYLERSYP